MRRIAISVLFPLLLILPSSAPASGGSLYGGVQYSGAVHPKSFRSGYTDAMGFAFGLEQEVAEGLRAVLDVSQSRFLPDAHAFSDGGRKLLIGGKITSFLITGNLKADLASSRGLFVPFVQAGTGLSVFSREPMETVDIFEVSLVGYPGASESRMAFRAGGGVVVRGTAGSLLDAQFDLTGTCLAGATAAWYSMVRMLVVLRLR